jgi:TatD DNase family protein
MAIIDTHCHLDHSQYLDDIENILQNAKEQGIESIIIPGADPKDLPRAVSLSEKYDEIYFAVGVHPYDIDSYDLEYLKKFVNHPKCVAVGECGLDYFRLPEDEDEKEANKKLQKEVFISQINFAKEVNKPLIVHIRDASNDSKIALIENDAKEVGGVLHCYNASEHLLDLSEHDFYFGIGGVVTFKNAKKLVEMVPKIPLDKLLVETDGPYLTPHPFRGTRNEPKYTNLVIEKLSELLDKTKEELEDITTSNAKILFKL